MNRVGIEWVAYSVGLRSRVAGLVLVALLAVALGILGPGRLVFVLGIVALLLAMLGSVTSASLTTPVLVLLVGQYALATKGIAPMPRVFLAAVVAIVLFTVHSVASLDAAIPSGAAIDRNVLRLFGTRLLVYCVIGGVSTGLIALVSTNGPRWGWLGVVGILAALALASVPILAFSRGRSH